MEASPTVRFGRERFDKMTRGHGQTFIAGSVSVASTEG